jgi:hypothetical protein
MIRYDRKLDSKHLTHFKKNGLLNFLILQPLIPDQTKYPGLKEFDIQIREDNNIAIYCGLTKILNIKFYQRGNVPFKFNSQSYSSQKFFPKIHDYSYGGKIQFEVENYLKNVTVNQKWWNKEGKVQTKYNSILGTYWNNTLPAAIFDKEIVFSYDSDPIKKKYNELIEEKVVTTKHQLTGNENWAKFKGNLPDEIDLMGLTQDGESLFLIEVKADNANSGEIYFSPFQLMSYLLKLKDALKENPGILNNINELISQKIEIGLLPSDFPKFKQIKKIVPVLAVNKISWSKEVQNRLTSVISNINFHNNNLLLGFEIWEIDIIGIKRNIPK